MTLCPRNWTLISLLRPLSAETLWIKFNIVETGVRSGLRMDPKVAIVLGLVYTACLPDTMQLCHWEVFTSIFQVEIYTINCLGKRILILSDNQASLKALVCFEIRSKQILNCRKNFSLLANHNKVILVWVTAHKRGLLLESQASIWAWLFCWMKNPAERKWDHSPGLREVTDLNTVSSLTSRKLSLGNLLV